MIELFKAGGLVMYPLTALSVFALAGIMERLIFWFAIIKQERKTAEKILVIARQDLKLAAVAAEQSLKVPVARFLYAPLALEEPDSELFRLALESTADEELTEMLKGEKLLEAVITIAPLLGLLGTVIGLISSFYSLKIGDVAANTKSGSLTEGIAEALITTATGLIIAIFASAFHRLFLALQDQQTKLFMKVGNQLELIYRKQCQHRLPK
ncbi:MAG: MotA/TolQ/ExbB proton channel family protein [Pseudanabaena sp. M135S2SP2A07QC]|nr:MotA/TolQ/ExbB proton channel family protein [Pseudanabaena sp. M090S1SP2A07QC]MCA6506313.1 MotA/TolQ/ExbB proton channel family protein [Pseudanabaena sp. M172S2SP2A07QC]MCA6520760.1 MotA/TolQ/ExbB proton channel family protein [Pseudanabaena sp. M051S1SP2A07QC]MCA6525805.1 MotA/TolQ/ExbB proton channel family protein [Pseudanabaena sp. M179S2SP2A07QC]MCA6528437.1 MotA/TolQ/ExbB proton channel family protein [Pseudanabaena sp. M125S2SP2A07QC]MCA6535513.1 MotA/TolQ/ExbB proton channel famil